MGGTCSTCCSNLDRRLRMIGSGIGDETEVQFTQLKSTNLQSSNKPQLSPGASLSVVVEDAYESQASFQNSYLNSQVGGGNGGGAAGFGTFQSFPTITSGLYFWIIDVQDNEIIISNENIPSMRIRARYNNEKNEFDISESDLDVLAAINTSSSYQPISNQLSPLKFTNTSNPNNNNNNNIQYTKNPLEEQVRQLYDVGFESKEKKGTRIKDFIQPPDETNMIDIWKQLLEGIVTALGIGSSSKLILINNFLRFSQTEFPTIKEGILRIAYETLQCTRFSLCSSGPLILKHANRKTGIVFDVSMNGFVYCMAVQDGVCIDKYFELIQYDISSSERDTVFIADLKRFFAKIDENFLRLCIKNGSIVFNNQLAVDTMISSVLSTVINKLIEENMTQNIDDSRIQTMFQPIIPSKPSTTRIAGVLELLRLNVLTTISKEKYDKLGPDQILKQKSFM